MKEIIHAIGVALVIGLVFLLGVWVLSLTGRP